MLSRQREIWNPEQRPFNMNHIERISCCSSVIFERNFDPNGSKRALDAPRRNQNPKARCQSLKTVPGDTPCDRVTSDYFCCAALLGA
jgi:hypothetical protein